ncbi:hypothetical protein NPIL_244061 [Nephila pilipes]|uniref:Uncharacterized protein n=1 Tax=Nephila pilipes TaxID=299642 RepID=A0A8X6NHN7_NEPPI|nr:hypothetical protein NPIL_244061 [Nephila pilipes]
MIGNSGTERKWWNRSNCWYGIVGEPEAVTCMVGQYNIVIVRKLSVAVANPPDKAQRNAEKMKLSGEGWDNPSAKSNLQCT